MANLDGGSGRPGISRSIGDFTVAGVATRVITVPPTDLDWEGEAPPNGMIVLQDPNILWIKTTLGWMYTVLDSVTGP